jgi:hypothetical protein
MNIIQYASQAAGQINITLSHSFIFHFSFSNAKASGIEADAVFQ